MSKTTRILGRPMPNASLPRNAFDRSESKNFNSFAGGIFPVYAQPFQKGAHLKINRSIFQRTADVNTAAFPIIDTHVEFFEVPLRQLWSPWYDFKLNIQDYQSSLIGGYSAQQGKWLATVFQSCPTFDLWNVTNQMFSTYRGTGVNTNIFGTSKAKCVEANRLLDLLGYGSYDLANNGGNESSHLAVNPFKLLAYHKIYMDHFRNSSYESNDPYSYNMDFHMNTATYLPDSFMKNILQMRYVNYRRDFFTNVYPALNYVVSNPNGLSWQIPSSVAGLASSAIQVQVNNGLSIQNASYNGNTGSDLDRWKSNGAVAIAEGTSVVVNNGFPAGAQSGTIMANYTGLAHDHLINHSHNNTLTGTITATASSNADYNVQNIRAAFALDKLLRQSAYAPKHVKDQMEARFGIKGTENDRESIRICSFMNDIIIGEVTQTAPGSDSAGGYQPLGTIGGKGIGGDPYKKGDFDYTCKDDCIIMGVMYTLPRASYDATFISNYNMKQAREDFFQPEFMDLGLQPVIGGEYYQRPSATGGLNSNILGYVPRYQEYKLGIDTNHGLFLSGNLLSPFAVHTNKSKLDSIAIYTSGLNAAFFKVSPSDLDSIFVDAFDPLQQTHDQFINHIDVKVIANQDMSVHGQPRL